MSSAGPKRFFKLVTSRSWIVQMARELQTYVGYGVDHSASSCPAGVVWCVIIAACGCTDLMRGYATGRPAV